MSDQSADSLLGANTPTLRRKVRAVVAYLVAADRAHQRQALADMFCQRAKDPAGSLRWLLSRIRRQLGSLRVGAGRSG